MHMHVCVHACVCHNVLSALHLSAKPSKTKVSSCYFSLMYLPPIFLSQHGRPLVLSSALRNTMENLVMWI